MRLENYLIDDESIQKLITYKLYCESFDTKDDDLDILIDR